MANKNNKIRSNKKRKFHGNRHCFIATTNTTTASESSVTSVSLDELSFSSASAQKLNISSCSATSTGVVDDDYFILMHFGIMKSVIQVLACQQCSSSDVKLELISADRQGLSNRIIIDCTNCHWSHNCYTSPVFSTPEHDIRGKKSHEVNIRSIMTFREIGRGHEALKTFTMLMNMPPPMCSTSYDSINNVLLEQYRETAIECTNRAAEEVRLMINNEALPSDTDPNEAFNQIIWGKCPKTQFVSRKIVELAVFSSVITYNEGLRALNGLFIKLGLKCGYYFHDGAQSKDMLRVKHMETKTLECTKSRRKELRGIKKGYIDDEKHKEGGESYSTGNLLLKICKIHYFNAFFSKLKFSKENMIFSGSRSDNHFNLKFSQNVHSMIGE